MIFEVVKYDWRTHGLLWKYVCFVPSPNALDKILCLWRKNFPEFIFYELEALSKYLRYPVFSF